MKTINGLYIYYFLLILCFVTAKETFAQQASKNVSENFAKKVAYHYAARRWSECVIGPAQVYYSLEGQTQVFCFLVLKNKDTLPTIDQPTNATNVYKSHVPSQTREATEWIKTRINSPEKYATIIIGANEGREPFIASYNGLPPHITLQEDAKKLRRKQVDSEKEVGTIRFIWYPPCFSAIQFIKHEIDTCITNLALFEVQGSRLLDTSHISKSVQHEHSHKVVIDPILRERKGKWDNLRRLYEE